jgi:hypothetical protein
MLAKLARIILALATFPLIGAYGLRWAGASAAQALAAAGVGLPPLLALDLIGGGIGLLLGLIFAVQIVGCALQPDTSPVRPVGDTLLVMLGFLLILDVVLAKVCGGAEWIRWLPAANLVIWAGLAAATGSLQRLRRQWRERQREQLPPPPPEAPPPTSYSSWNAPV